MSSPVTASGAGSIAPSEAELMRPILLLDLQLLCFPALCDVLGQFDTVAVSMEPQAGSLLPTGPIVLLGSISG